MPQLWWKIFLKFCSGFRPVFLDNTDPICSCKLLSGLQLKWLNIHHTHFFLARTFMCVWACQSNLLYCVNEAMPFNSHLHGNLDTWRWAGITTILRLNKAYYKTELVSVWCDGCITMYMEICMFAKQMTWEYMVCLYYIPLLLKIMI